MLIRWTQDQPGFVAARLRAAVPGSRWDRAGAECGVVQLWYDGTFHQDVILVRGEEEADYERLLGDVAAGPHTLQVRPHPAAPPRPGARLLALETQALVPSDALEAQALRECPVIYTRAEQDPWESLWTDTPLMVFHRPRGAGLEFQCMFSNEDGGTDTRGLLAQWGRTTDIEWVLHLEGEQATIQGRGHHTEVHSGHTALGRRTLQVVGLHGMVSSEPPWGAMRCLFVPRFRWDDRLPREACMDHAPWTYRLTALEMLREGKLHPDTDPADPVPGDLRDYAFVQIVRSDHGARPPAPGAPPRPPTAIEIRVHLRDGRVFSSTHGEARQACARAYPFSTTVKLPKGAVLCRVEAVALPPLPEGEMTLRLHKLFRLDASSLPLPPDAEGADVSLRRGEASVTLWEG